MELRLTKVDNEIHRAAKMLATAQGISLNEFCLAAIRERVVKYGGSVEKLFREVGKPAKAGGKG